MSACEQRDKAPGRVRNSRRRLADELWRRVHGVRRFCGADDWSCVVNFRARARRAVPLRYVAELGFNSAVSLATCSPWYWHGVASSRGVRPLWLQYSREDCEARRRSLYFLRSRVVFQNLRKVYRDDN